MTSAKLAEQLLVRVININEGDDLIAIARGPRDDDDEDDEGVEGSRRRRR